jgi:hypothetical protein
MFNFKSFSLLVLLAAPTISAFDRYGGYLPSTSITDVAAIDLDQVEFNTELAERRVEMAMYIYEEGGHSGSYADLTITNFTKAADYPAGTIVRGLSAVDDMVNGTLKEKAQWSAGTTNPIISVKYDVSDVQQEYVDCQVGGLNKIGGQRVNLDGCKYLPYVAVLNFCVPSWIILSS